MESDIGFRGHLSLLADEYERVCNLSALLRKDNTDLRARLGESFDGESTAGSPKPMHSIGKNGALHVKGLEAQATSNMATSRLKVPWSDSLDDDMSSIPSGVPEEGPLALGTEKSVLQEVMPGEARFRSQGNYEIMFDGSPRDPSTIDIDVGIMYDSEAPSYIDKRTDKHVGFTSSDPGTGSMNSMTGSFVTASMTSKRPSHTSRMSSQSLRYLDLSLSLPIFPKWFDPGFTNLEDLEQHTTVESTFEDWVPEVVQVVNWVLMPVGWLRLTWDCCAFLVLLVDMWVTPFEMFFISEIEPPYAFTGLQHAITIFFTIDILLNFNTGYVEGDRTEMDRRQVIKHYFRGWFWIDLFATVPFDLILTSVGTGMFSAARLGKASKVIKTLRYLKLLRAVKIVRLTAQANTMGQHFPILAKVQKVALPAQVELFLLFFAHIHCCMLAVARSESTNNATLDAALRSYLEHFWWAFCAITVGSSLGPSGPGGNRPWVWVIEMVLVSERLFLLCVVTMQLMFRSLSFVDVARGIRARDQVLKYLRHHRVSFKTQIQVLHSLRDTGQAKKYQLHAKELFANELPHEIRCSISEELWAERLTSLALIGEVATWHRDFLRELSLIVYEEVFASRAVVFKLGDAASEAYNILKGELCVVQLVETICHRDFSKGMWVGESALSSAHLRRSATITTRSISHVMALPGASFQEQISRFGMMERYQRFLSKELWKGLCGRCGKLGDHFSDTCNEDFYSLRRSSLQKRSSFAETSTAQGSVGEMQFMSASTMNVLNEASYQFDLEMNRYFITHSLEELVPALRELLPDVRNLDTLILTGLDDLKDRLLSGGCYLTREQDVALSEVAIQKFRTNNEERVAQTLFRQVSRLHHLVFLSHYKVEAGTEAALMRTELELAIQRDPGSPGHYFDEPVFLDSDNLTNLEDIGNQVKRTHNLVLLLTRGVLTRPWVLIELVTAIREGVRIHLVKIAKSGCEFQFPDDQFYEDLRNGESLSEQAWNVIRSCDIAVEEVVEVIKLVLKKIAITYSPHKSTGIRQAEIGSLLKECQLKC